MAKPKKKDTNLFEFTVAIIIDSCLDILHQKNMIVYPNGNETHNDTTFTVKQMSNGIIGDSIFTVYGPSYGYGVKIIATDVNISGYNLSPDNATRLRRLWNESDAKSSKQKELREEIANKKLMSSLMATQYHLRNLVTKTKE